MGSGMARRIQRFGLAVGVASISITVMAAGFPAAPESAAAPQRSGDELGLLDVSGMSPEEIVGLDPDDGPDERRLAEETGKGHPDRPEIEGADPVKVAAVDSSRSLEHVPDPPAPIVSPRAQAPVRWPERGSAQVDLAETVRGDRAGRTRVSGLPISLSAEDRGRAAVAGLVDVELIDRDGLEGRGAVGALITPADTAATRTAAAGIEVVFDYSGFGHAFGGDYGSRLRALAYPPECAGDVSECVGEPMESVNDPAAGTVGTAVELDSAGMLIVLTADDAGPSGDWSATSLSPSGEWSQGGSSGDFTWSYSMRTPDMPGGLGPELSVSYSAQSVDGRTTSTNNQTSWVGEGFDLSPGSIERRYVGCADDMGSGANNTVETGDLCWKSENATMSLGGSSTVLVKDSGSGAWRPKNDDGTRVEHLTGAANGARNGEYWRVTTTDGVQYHFGLHNRYAGDTAATNSVQTVPVAGNHSGEPCYASAFADSFCTQAYRWNLDYVVDPNGNTMTYFYSRESNRYGRNLNDTSVSYHRGGYLTRIEYGQRKGSEHSTPAPARVVFTTSERCLSNCTDLTQATADNWPDVPFDRICTSTSSCADRYSPSFFSRKRLTQLETQVRVSGTYQAVDRWVLAHEFPDPGDGNSAALWLKSIIHSGRAGTAVTLPAVTFTGSQMPNRVDEVDGAPPLIKYRVTAIRSETGAQIAVQYSDIECQPGGTMPTPHTNAKRCFPVYWKHEGSGQEDPRVHWFHKYVADKIVEHDGTGGSVAVEHHYTYEGSPAWAYNDDQFVKAEYRTWGQWRGYGTVTTRVGEPDGEQPQLRTEALYLRGLHGDRSSPSGGTKSVVVTDSWSEQTTDHEHWAGVLREERVFNGSEVVSSTVHDPWRSAVTADNGKDQARFVDVGATREHTKLSGSTWRTTEVEYAYDSHGLLVETNDRGDIAFTADDLCTRTEYAKSTSPWLLDAVKRVETVSKRCSVSPPRPGDVVSDERYSYDGGAYGTAPTKGNVTKTEVLDSWSGGPVYVTTSRASYDAHGRVISAWDALDRKTTTAYTPSTGGPVTQTVVTNPAGHVTTTALDARLGVPTRVTDANGRHTDAVYDALGRLTKAWFTDRDSATHTPSVEYVYKVSASAPVAVTTKSLLPSGAYATSVTLYDSLLRPRQTQEPAQWANGGRVVALTEYDSRGLAVEEKGPFYATGNPSTVLVEPTESVERQRLTEFDGAGRVTTERLVIHHDEHSRRTTSYGGDRVHVTPPAGGTATTVVADARGRTSELREYHGPSPSGVYDATSYTYTPAGELASMTDAAGNSWSYSYDLRGRRVSVSDPDAGVSITVYDTASQVTSTTDGRGETLTYTYDALGRMIRTRDGSGTALAEWVYDTIVKGQLTSSTRWAGGNPYTTTVIGYDAGYRPWGETVTIPAAEGTLAGNYTSVRLWNPDGSLQVATEPAVAGLPQESLRTNYNAAGAPEWFYGERTYVADTVYSPLGLVRQYSLGTDLGKENWQTFSYEEGTHRLAGMEVERAGVDPVDANVAYTYDAAGNPTRIADIGGLAGVGDVQCYLYDHHRRLADAWSQASGACASGPASAALGGVAAFGQSYSYDLAGNRTQLVDHVAETVSTYSYPAPGADGPHTLVGMTTAGSSGTEVSSFTYDEAGNTVGTTGAVGVATHTWDAEGHMESAETAEGASEFVYTADGDRLIRRDSAATTVYVFGTEIRLDHATQAVSGTRYYSFNGQVLAMREGEDIFTLGADVWGTPTISIHNTTHAATARRFDPFGNPRGSTPGMWPGERGFHTGTMDPATGLVHMGARQYHAATGRFLSVDPLIDVSDSQQVHGYAYANNNPLAYTDPNGLEPRPWHSPSFDSKTFNYDKYWEGERNAYAKASGGCKTNCGKSGQSAWPSTTKDKASNQTKTSSTRTRRGGGGSFGRSGGDDEGRSYQYTYSHYIGQASIVGSAEEVANVFAQYPHYIFPFPIEGCDEFVTGAVCTLHAGPSLVGGVGDVKIIKRRTSVQFTVASHDYFDEAGSTITFSFSETDGAIYLSQRADATGVRFFPWLGVQVGYAKRTWVEQATNLRSLYWEYENYMSRRAEEITRI